MAEQRAIEIYIQEALTQGYIRHSTSPASAGFFFVEKKGGDFRPCIDYRGLTQVSVKYHYPFPLVHESWNISEQLFTKLDLCSAYNLVHMREGDKWKIQLNSILFV